MAVDMAIDNEAPGENPVVPSQEDLAETVEPDMHQNDVLLQEILLPLSQGRSFFQVLP